MHNIQKNYKFLACIILLAATWNRSAEFGLFVWLSMVLVMLTGYTFSSICFVFLCRVPELLLKRVDRHNKSSPSLPEHMMVNKKDQLHNNVLCFLKEKISF